MFKYLADLRTGVRFRDRSRSKMNLLKLRDKEKLERRDPDHQGGLIHILGFLRFGSLSKMQYMGLKLFLKKQREKARK